MAPMDSFSVADEKLLREMMHWHLIEKEDAVAKCHYSYFMAHMSRTQVDITLWCAVIAIILLVSAAAYIYSVSLDDIR